jgi:hypothetical protein
MQEQPKATSGCFGCPLQHFEIARLPEINFIDDGAEGAAKIRDRAKKS